jgi:hypothetical protein
VIASLKKEIKERQQERRSDETINYRDGIRNLIYYSSNIILLDCNSFKNPLLKKRNQKIKGKK